MIFRVCELRLEILREDRASGWSWYRAGDGPEGWVPDRTLAPVA
jgi:hypothetical protein